MKVEKFVDDYNVSSNKDKFLKDRVIKKYIPYQEKIDLCNRIVKSTTYEDSNHLFYKQNTPIRYMMFALSIIQKYTDIEFKIDENSFDIFNLLDMNNLVDEIISFIPEKEYNQIKTVLNMVEEDEYANNRDIVSYLDVNFKSALGYLLKQNVDSIQE